jgi:multiple sugar transport system substrate-binding protein
MIAKVMLLSGAAIAALCVYTPVRAETVDYNAKYGITDVPGLCSYAETDKKDYTGHKITILTHAVPVMGEPVALHSKQFEELTGGKVEVIHAPFGELYQKVMIPFQTGQHIYDIVYGGSYWIGDWAPYLAPVPQKYLDTDEMKDITPAYQGVATWNGQRLQYTFDGDRNYFKYYAPPFQNEEYKKKFKEKYGRDLAVPTTWEEYDQVAEFFSGWDWMGDGKIHYGSTEIVARDNVAFSNFITRVASYAKNPNVKGGFWFDLETMTPQVNNPGFVRGLEMWVKALRYMPPGGINFGIAEEIFSWGGGQSLMSVTWDDAFVQAQQPDSPIQNKVLVGSPIGPSMGTKEVWNRVTKQWDKFETPSIAPYVTWGWGAGVTAASKEKDMAFDWFCFFSNYANTNHDEMIGRFGVNPFRTSHMDSEYWMKGAGWSKEVADSFVKMLKGMDTSTNRVFDLRVPGVNQYYTAMMNSVAKAMAGEMTAQAALDEAAAEWKRITEEIGVDVIREAYKNVVRLEDNE